MKERFPVLRNAADGNEWIGGTHNNGSNTCPVIGYVELDILPVEEKKEKVSWINVYMRDGCPFYGCEFRTKENALIEASGRAKDYIETVKIVRES